MNAPKSFLALLWCLFVVCVVSFEVLTDDSKPAVPVDKLDPDTVDGVHPFSNNMDISEAKYMKVEFQNELSAESLLSNESSGEFFPQSSSSKKSYLRMTRPLQNYTKIVGDNIKLRCEVEGFPPPRFKWFKNEAPIQEERAKIVIRRLNTGDDKYVSRLRISKLDTFDTAYYKCQVSNDGHQVKTSAIVKVRLAKGELPGTIPSFAPIFPLNPSGEDRGPSVDMTGLKGQCYLYRGTSACSPYVGNRSVFVQPPNTIKDLEKRLKVTLSSITSNNGMSKLCEKYAVKFMCYHTFPLCSGKSDKEPRTLCQDECQVLEKEVCVKEYALARNYDLVGKNNIIPNCKDLPPVHQSVAKNCIRIGVSTATPTETMITSAPTVSSSIPGSEKPSVFIADGCYSKRGEDYRGKASKTVSGKTCLLWSAKILNKIDQYPELVGHNYCRNPGGQENRPWCYTDDELRPVEHCDIAKCEEECYSSKGEEYKGKVSTTVTGKFCLAWAEKIQDKIAKYPELKGHNYCRNPGGQEDKPWCYTGNELKPVEVCEIPECGNQMWMYIAIPCAGVFVFMVLVCIICCIRRTRSKSSARPKPNSDLPTLPQAFNSHKFMGHDVEMNSIWQKTIGPVRVREIPPSTVSYFEELGEGTFGNVYRGEVSALNMDKTVTSVVIKALKTGANTAMFQTFRQEVEVMTDLKHPNIVCLLAVCLSDQPFCMLFECPMGGNLHEYLMKVSRSASSASDKSRSYCALDVGEFLCISTQVASGMEYLSSQHYVHRDLATRNCLIGENLNIKISNFGLARDTYACDYYHSPVNGLLPIRWMPSEAILYGKFSTESDVWSFGVLLWEILSHGRQPYYGYSNQEVIDMISSRQVLPCPDDSSTQVYGLMLECWADVSAKRPTFQELHLRLHSWQVLHNMGNLNSSQFFRPHSDSQYSSTGPSNRTGSTHVSSIAAPSTKSFHDSSTHSGISSQPVTVIGLDRSVSSRKASSSVRSDSPSHSSVTGLCVASMHSSSIVEPRSGGV